MTRPRYTELLEPAANSLSARALRWIKHEMNCSNPAVPFTPEEMNSSFVHGVFSGTIVSLAIHYCKWPLVEALLAAGADPNGGSLDFSYLLLLCMVGNAKLGSEEERLVYVKRLIELGADPRFRTSTGINAVACCSVSGYATIMRYFLTTFPDNYKCEVDLTKVRGEGAEIDLSEAIKLQNGKTPVTVHDLPMVFIVDCSVAHIAAWLGYCNIMEMFVELGMVSVLSAPCRRGTFPFDAAINQTGNDKIVMQLRKHCATGSHNSELLSYHNPFSLFMGLTHVARKGRNRMSAICEHCPDAARQLMESSAWLYCTRGQTQEKLVSIFPFVLDHEHVCKLDDENDPFEESAITAELLARIDPVETLWGKICLGLWEHNHVDAFQHCPTAQLIMKLKWNAFGRFATELGAVRDLAFAVFASLLAFSQRGTISAIIFSVCLACLSLKNLLEEFAEMQRPCAKALALKVAWYYMEVFCSVAILPVLVSKATAWFWLPPGILAVIVVVAWVDMLQYLSLFVTYAGLVKMIAKMISDVFKFASLFVFFQFAFAVAFHIVLHDVDSPKPEQAKLVPGGDSSSHDQPFATLSSSFFSCYRIALGDLLFEELQGRGWVVLGFWTAYTLIAALLLLNMLIAMMASTFERVGKHAVGEMLSTRACSLMRLERAMSYRQRVKMWKRVLASINHTGFWPLSIAADGTLADD